ncbi:hypothetical protein ES319_D01G079000v1 [Gossypium barbadense]|uniref:F-box domain-containing protein n=2 Tax=Gossypium TaxID=3633 RepID=A0A5J5SS24_GOSBA|nr:hypothetical protein ES319_D01G079000v1 [Gossypium barbadense]TYG82435.1 hypothetical protein ES288_D01G087800v1 [Gossypium darwinii]
MCCKKVKIEDVDRISDLPDSILTHILSFLSTKEAVGTSILSSRWRYIFTLVPNLHFDLVDDWCHKNLESCILHIKSFISFFDKPLSLHETSLDRFHLKCREMVHGPRVYSWISTAVRRGVKHLDISISPDQFTSPGIMFTCRSLTTLKLDFTCSVLDVPRGVPFPNLKTLHLKSVEFLSDDTTKCLLSSCNNLEDLVIAHCNIENLFNFTISHHLLEIDYTFHEVLSKLPEKVAYCLLSKLKVMEILGFRNDKDVIEKAKYILKNVGALQKLTIRTLSNISKAKKLKISEVLLGSPRESKHCCILIV